MKISLLAIALLAATLVCSQALLASSVRNTRQADGGLEIDEEPDQSEDEEVDDNEAATQDEPVNDADETDDDAAKDEPVDLSEETATTDEPLEVDDTEEPPVPEEEEGEGDEGPEQQPVEDESEDTPLDESVRERRAVNARCQGPPGVGTCKQKINRFTYDVEKKKCVPFVWSGCGAKPNNWLIIQNCQNACEPKPAKPAVTPKPTLPPAHPDPKVKWNDKIRCVGPELRGPCTKNIKRYHYNPVTNQCNAFQYGGCGGNDNNFVFLANCNKACVTKAPKPQPKPAQPPMKWNDKRRCQGPVVAGPCKGLVRRFHYDAVTNKCSAFSWGGCNATPNTWVYVKNCQKVCVANRPAPKIKWDDPKRCVGPKVRGPCNKNIRRYHYNAQTDKCEAFSFGGCEGNINNWAYVKNCQKICVKNKPAPPPKVPWNDKRRCAGAAAGGPCNKKIRRFNYNAIKDQCEPFEYSGCGGNSNNWWYKGNCQKICASKRLPWNDANRCKGPEIRGPCKKNIRRYHYDADQDKCVPFSYGGCAGNDNNWWYVKNCQRICVKKQVPEPEKPKWDDPRRCQGPVVVGNCKKSIRRFHYNPATDKCEPFQYSGCGGNDNNWWYLRNCQKICVKSPGGGDPDEPVTPSGPVTTDNGSATPNVGSTTEIPDDGNDDGGYGGIEFNNDPAECQGANGTETKIPNPCPKVLCHRRCRYGFVADHAGCPTCECSHPPCKVVTLTE